MRIQVCRDDAGAIERATRLLDGRADAFDLSALNQQKAALRAAVLIRGDCVTTRLEASLLVVNSRVA